MKKKLHPRASVAGMTLLELMLACAIVGVSLSLLFGAMTNFGNVGTISSDRSQAMVLLAGTVEQLRFLPYNSLVAYAPQTLSSGPGTSRALTLNCYDSSGNKVTLPIAGTPPANLPNPLEVRAQLTWQDKRGRAYSASMSMMVPR